MHTRLCILLVLTGCVYAATDDSNSTSSNNITTTTQSPSTTTTDIPSTTSTTSSPSTTSTTSSPSTTSTTSSSSTTSTTSSPSTTSTTSTPSTTSTTSSPSTTSTTSSPSSTASTTSTTSTTLRPPGPPRPPRPSGPLRPPRPSGPLRPPRPSGPHGPPGRLVPPQQLPIPQIVNQGIRIADNIARTIFGNSVPPPSPGNRGGPNPRHPRAAAFSVSDPLKMMSLNGSLTAPSFSNMANFPMPNIDEMVPDIPQSSSNYSDIDIPKISSYESPASRYVPGVQDALDHVHEMISNELQPGADMPEAIQTAMQDILASDNPTDGLRELCSMVMNAYRTVAERCPLFIAKKCILVEGLRCVQNMINILEYVTSQE